MTTYNNILTELTEGILTITINRPDKLNALNHETIAEVGKAISAAESNVEVSGIILTGSGTKAFIAGADISEFADFNLEEGKKLAADGHKVFDSVEACEKPVIAAINGFALGGGCELAMACHLRVASEKARFGQPEVNLGIIPGYGGTQRLIQYLGKTKALELLMTGDMFGAEEAYRLGLLNYVVPAGEELNKALELLGKIAAKAPIAIQKVIECVNTYFDNDGFRREVIEFANTVKTEDFKEGASAFLEKRTANFQGK
jgi:enoyl-CoA hydratase